mmetsp:Transcript_29713/g.95239  ORF Transcript_29713/g.95239 Transcript_29713/m.95239 type:complete len:98 (+) Transcript_29713:330-623(+)
MHSLESSSRVEQHFWPLPDLVNLKVSREHEVVKASAWPAVQRLLHSVDLWHARFWSLEDPSCICAHKSLIRRVPDCRSAQLSRHCDSAILKAGVWAQ